LQRIQRKNNIKRHGVHFGNERGIDLTQMGFKEADSILLVRTDLWKFLLSRRVLWT